jgi:hypothetical protein
LDTKYLDQIVGLKGTISKSNEEFILQPTFKTESSQVIVNLVSGHKCTGGNVEDLIGQLRNGSGSTGEAFLYGRLGKTGQDYSLDVTCIEELVVWP